MRSILVALLLFGVAGCGGYRTGISSEPYADAAGSSGSPVKIQGIDVDVIAHNSIRTTDSGWLFPGIPLYVNPIHKPYFTDAPFKISVLLHPRQEGFSFCPEAARLILDSTSYSPTGFQLEGTFPHVLERPPDSTCEAATVFSLEPGGDAPSFVMSRPVFVLSFPVRPPHPDKEFRLDLSRAISHPDHPVVPIIKFRKEKWSESISIHTPTNAQVARRSAAEALIRPPTAAASTANLSRQSFAREGDSRTTSGQDGAAVYRAVGPAPVQPVGDVWIDIGATSGTVPSA